MSKNDKERSYDFYSFGEPIPPEIAKLVQNFIDDILKSQEDDEQITLKDIVKETADQLGDVANVTKDLKEEIENCIKEDEKKSLNVEKINGLQESIKVIQKLFDTMCETLRLTGLAIKISLLEAEGHENPTFGDFFS